MGPRLSRVYEEEASPLAGESEVERHGPRAGLLVSRSRSTSSVQRENLVLRPRSGTFELEDTQVGPVPGSAF